MENVSDNLSFFAKLRRDWRIYLVMLIVVAVAERIGTFRFRVGPGFVVIFPLLYGIAAGLLSGPELIGIFSAEECRRASRMVLVAIAPFMAKLGISAGGNLAKLVELGPALILQEFGNLATVFLAMPVAVALGLGREAIGACHSINRETNIGLISHVYGADSAEMRGTMSVFVVGGVVGTVYLALLASFMASWGIFHPYALAMATGVGSGSMMAAAAGSLGEIYPDMKDQIMMLGGASDMLTGVTGIYAGYFLALPLSNWLYRVLTALRGKRPAE